MKKKRQQYPVSLPYPSSWLLPHPQPNLEVPTPLSRSHHMAGPGLRVRVCVQYSAAMHTRAVLYTWLQRDALRPLLKFRLRVSNMPFCLTLCVCVCVCVRVCGQCSVSPNRDANACMRMRVPMCCSPDSVCRCAWTMSDGAHKALPSQWLVTHAPILAHPHILVAHLAGPLPGQASSQE